MDSPPADMASSTSSSVTGSPPSRSSIELAPHRSPVQLPLSSAAALGGGMSTVSAMKSPIIITPSSSMRPSTSSASIGPGMTGSEGAAVLTPGGLLMTKAGLEHSSTTDNTGKSIPIHCVVEQVSGSACRPAGSDIVSPTKSPPGGSIQRGGVRGTSSTSSSGVELDTFAIVPGSCLFSELVRTALVKIGYSTTEAIGAKGTIQLKHWKALTFDTITENPDVTVEQILGDLTSVATLRIRLCSKSKAVAMEDMKEKLLQFLVHHSQGMLTSLGCPIEKSLLSQLVKGEYGQTLPEETREAFNTWYREQTSQAKSPHKEDGLPKPSHLEPKGLSSGPTSHIPEGLKMGVEAGLLGPHSKVRMRTSFDPEHEIPRLHKWFSQNHHPSREQMLLYLAELNSLESRKGRKPLDLTNIIYWFKNARAAQRRANCMTPSKSDDLSRECQPSPESPDVEGEVDMEGEHEQDTSLDDRLSPSSTEHVPVLPNRNAVYVVQPLPPAKDEKIEIVHFNEEDSLREHGERPNTSPQDFSTPRPSSLPSQYQQREGQQQVEQPRGEKSVEGDENHNKCLALDSHHHQQEEATDLSMRSRRNSSDSGLHSSHDSASMKLKFSSASSCFSELGNGHLKREREEDDDEDEEHYHSSCSSNTSSPRLPSGLAGRELAVKSPASLSQPPHLAPHFQHHALQIAAMSHAFNMQYMHPASLYGVDTSPLSVGSNAYKDDDGSPSNGMDADRKKRSRVFIDPLTEIPKLEKWFLEDTHPSSYMIEKYTEELNRSTYRQRFPKLEPKNVQLWFKNHRAKVKRQRLEVPC